MFSGESWLQVAVSGAREDAEALEQLLFDVGAQSVTLEDGADDPLFEPAPGTLPLWPATRLLALFPPDTDSYALQARLSARVPGLDLRVEQVADRDWRQASMERSPPRLFGRRLWICPSWSEPPDPAGVVVGLDPGLAFGTGSHPTTALCLEWLDGAAVQGRVLVDYGCGSGILAIAALRLGATMAWAVDHDPQALSAARENAARNGVSDRLVTVLPQALPDVRVDLVLANILARPLVESAERLAGLLIEGGDLVLSGILADQVPVLQAAYRDWIPELVATEREGWMRLAGKRETACTPSARTA